jgi:Tfp pilus assembly protein PilN
VFTRATTEDAGGAVFLRKRDRPPSDDVSRGSLIATGGGRRRFPAATSLTAYRTEWHGRELEQRNAVLAERLADAERRAADLLTVRAQLDAAEQHHRDGRAELEQRVARAEAEAVRLRQALEEATVALSHAKAARAPEPTSRRRPARARLRALKHLLTRR